jgi:UDP:flavonoid glycosyltransferase YjiC (YdhE family)
VIALFPHCGFLSETSRMLALHSVTHAVRRLVDEPSYRGQAQRLQSIVAQTDGAKTAARVISRYLADLHGRSASATAVVCGEPAH